MNNFKLLTRSDLPENINIRPFETKIGEVIQCSSGTDFEKDISSSSATYVIVGIPEQAGVLANYGRAGTETLWRSFLKSFLNIQSNDYLKGEDIFLAGYFDFNSELKLISATAPDKGERIKALQSLVRKMDDQVEEVVKIISRNKKIPIIIGGGHNNAYGNIKGSAKGLHSIETLPLAQINVINLDAHADYREREGRHSGNAFRYADEDGYLHKYFLIGAHENYFQQYVIKDISETPFINYITYEDIFIREKLDFVQAIAQAIEFTDDNYTGIELDVDSIEKTLSSAMTPCGISSKDARRYLYHTATKCKVAYLHICEGAAELENDLKDPLTGKLVSYLVSDFIKSHAKASVHTHR